MIKAIVPILLGACLLALLVLLASSHRYSLHAAQLTGGGHILVDQWTGRMWRVRSQGALEVIAPVGHDPLFDIQGAPLPAK